MNCDKIRLMIDRQIDGQLSQAEQVILSEHLKNCPECKTYQSRLLNLEGMSQDFIPDGDEKFWLSQKDKIIDRINRLEEEKVVPAAARKKSGFLFKAAAVAASIAIIAFISIYEYEETHPGKEILPGITAPSRKEEPKPSVQTPPAETTSAAGMKEEAAVSTKPSPQIEEGRMAETTSPKDLEGGGPAQAEQKRKAESDEAAATEGSQIKEHNESAARMVERESPAPAVTAETLTKNIVPKYTSPKLPQEKLQAEAGQGYLDKSAQAEAVPAPPVTTAKKSPGKAGQAELSKTVRVGRAVESEAVQSNLAAPNRPGEVSNEDLETYAEWRGRLEYLEARYDNSPGGPNQGVTAKGRTPADSRRVMTADLAEAYYNVARLTPERAERSAMIKDLQNLLHGSDAVISILIKNYLGILLSSDK